MAWLFQDTYQKRKHGDKAKWSVGWKDPQTGGKRSKAIGTRRQAKKFLKELEAKIITGTYESSDNHTWAEFRIEYEAQRLAKLAYDSQERAKQAFDIFERIAKPHKLKTINGLTFERYTTARLAEPGIKPGSTVSPATVNIELRAFRSAFGVAEKWNWIPKRPAIELVKVTKDMIRPVEPEHFEAMYNACEVAQRPGDNPEQWWKSFLSVLYMTGWRRREALLLERRNIDVEGNRVILAAAGTKGKRAEHIALDSQRFTMGHIEAMLGNDPEEYVFPVGGRDWRFLYVELAKIQKKAGIHLRCNIEREHECTASCHRYGFHDFRRGFATNNYSRMPFADLQRSMRHRCESTTKLYVDESKAFKDAAPDYFVPRIFEPEEKDEREAG